MATVRKRKDSPYWWVYWSVNGQSFAKSIGIRHDNCRNKKPARTSVAHKWLVKFENELAFSTIGISSLEDITSNDLINKYIDDLKSQVESGAIKPTYFDDQHHRAKHWRTRLSAAGITSVKALTAARALEYRTNRISKIAPTSWNRECGYLYTLWEFAKRLGCETKNEWEHLSLAKARAKKKKRSLTDDEINTMFERGHELGNEWMYITNMMYFTGCRIGSAVELLVESVLFDERTIWLSNKNSDDHNAYMPTPLMTFLQNFKPSGDTWLKKPNTNYWTAKWARDIQKIGLDFTAHYVRNTYITKLSSGNLSQRATMNIVGHANAKVHELYNHNTAWEHAPEIERSLSVRFLQNDGHNVTALKSAT
tara:strand:- start:677 stop:1774 length:1098 start_codon:yes stop_codon:yes gene_type:complete